jgi:hypothetical protein
MNIFVLVSDTLTGFFGSSSGWRQGDTLSPYLFVIFMEALSRMISAMVSKGLFSGFSVGSRNVGAFNISHLLFADDSLMFCEANLDHLCNFHCLFLCFEVVSGLRINLAKSELVASTTSTMWKV